VRVVSYELLSLLVYGLHDPVRPLVREMAMHDEKSVDNTRDEKRQRQYYVDDPLYWFTAEKDSNRGQ
jgi:hypothetical protein